ncbi:Gfo/Idh/MocA family protein [Haliea sp. E17]|uniref:Gfo/Idh/MocA family protein n=1 Tax=Haliea sp. E17 TaxID=3401576 RepID=UPI003AACE23B
MSSKPFRVAIAGANPQRGWGRDAHLPALQALPGFSVAAVSAREQSIADAAAKTFGAQRAYGNTLGMVEDPEVDLVAVTVKVPEHRAIVLAALAAGKHVYCEWPLGIDLAEAQEMAAAVPAACRAFIGLQGLYAPALRQASGYIREGRIGRPQVLRVYSTAGAWGTEVPPFYAYLQDKRTGATMETIGGGHTLAAIESLVGPYVEVDARNSIQHPRVRIAGSDEWVERSCADHMLVLGRHAGGCVSTLEVVGGRVKRPVLFEIEGESGWIRVSGTEPGTYQIAPLQLEASFEAGPPPAAAVPALAGPAANVAEIYARISEDLDKGSSSAPGFTEAVRLSRLLLAIDTASATGARQSL